MWYHRLDEEWRIAKVAAAVLEPTAQLSLDRAPAPVDLILEAAERVELPLRRDHLLDSTDTERTDQLIFEVLVADVGRVTEDSAEPALLPGVAEPCHRPALVLRERATDRLCAADGDDFDSSQPQAEPRGHRLERQSVGDPFDEDDSHARKLA